MISQRLAGLAAAVSAGCLVCLVECSSPEKLAGEGEACQVLTDCKLTLFCVPVSASQNECWADASALVKTEEGGTSPEAAPVISFDGGAAPRDAGTAPTSDGASPPPPPSDAGTAVTSDM